MTKPDNGFRIHSAGSPFATDRPITASAVAINGAGQAATDSRPISPSRQVPSTR